jgi:nucleotide-binding universal stress UspA family protein
VFTHLLVPLDGSTMAESALPVAAGIAARTHAALTLVHVIERHAPSEVHSERHLVTPREAADYLDEVSRRPIFAGLAVQTHVHEAEVRDVARSITEHTAELAPDLVVMSTHGRGGARRLFSGTLAQKVIGRGATPVLLVGPDAEVREQGVWRLILAPVDGNPAHEKGLPIAAELAAAFGCTLHLLMVTPHIGELTGSEKWTSTLLPGATRLKLEIESTEAQEYLARVAQLFGQKGIAAGSETSRGDPARAIVRTARRLSADLIVMATHGRAGTDAFWEGSVAARVVSRARVPLLLVPLRE